MLRCYRILALACQASEASEDGSTERPVQLPRPRRAGVRRARSRVRGRIAAIFQDFDAPTEHALFERFAGAARRAATGSGAITVLISHRFSTVRMADLILVMAGGKIAERGDHATLVRAGGLYAELYELQRRAYQ